MGGVASSGAVVVDAPRAEACPMRDLWKEGFLMAKKKEPERSYWAKRRDDVRGGPPREPKPCGTIAAARRHQRAKEPMCEPCAVEWKAHQHAMYQQRAGTAKPKRKAKR